MKVQGGSVLDTGKSMRMKVSELTFDRKNPRLVEFGLTDRTPEDEVIRILWEAMDVRELVMSIAASGFFEHEPVIVTRENEANVVIEGNRRLAAVKVLLDPDLLNRQVPDITEDDRKKLKEIPIVRDSREGAWRHLGFKHVNGPAKWSSYAKSQYIADVHRNFGVKLEDIASQIGDTHKTVQRLFRGLMVIEQAERLKVFDREDRWRNHFAFSHLYTGLSGSGISTFIGLHPDGNVNRDSRNPVPSEKKKELGELCLWLYGSRKDKKPPVIQTQNPHLRQLDAVVSKTESLEALRSGQGLALAYEVSRPSSNVFSESLYAAKRSLRKAYSMLPTGYDDSEELLRVAGTVANMADDLYIEMERKNNPGGKKRRLAEDD